LGKDYLFAAVPTSPSPTLLNIHVVLLGAELRPWGAIIYILYISANARLVISYRYLLFQVLE